MLSGSSLGKESTLAARASAPIGAVLPDKGLFWGVPAQLLSAQAPAKPNQRAHGLTQNLAALALPILLPLTAAWLITIPAYLTVAVVSRALLVNKWLALALTPVFFVGFGAALAACVVAFKWAVVGRVPACETSRFSLFSAQRALAKNAEVALVVTFMETLRGSLLYAWLLRLLGSEVGRGCYIDTFTCLPDSDMLRWDDGAAVGRSATIFGHLGQYQQVLDNSLPLLPYCNVYFH